VKASKAVLGVLVLCLLGCSGETIEVGARVDNARASGDLPPATESPGMLTGASLEKLPALIANAGFRNARPEGLNAVLDEWGVPAPIREDLTVYVRKAKEEGIEAAALGDHITAFVLERHDPGSGLRSMTEAEILSLGMAIALGNESAIASQVASAPKSRMLHCTHASEVGVLISSYAVAAVKTLEARGHSCTPVRVKRAR
jgi:hypothetical protein